MFGDTNELVSTIQARQLAVCFLKVHTTNSSIVHVLSSMFVP